MSDLDVIIGANVVAHRGTMSQKVVAAQMKAKGWKWSQSTVWSVEAGERPLRLAEARDLAEILGTHPEDLLVAPRDEPGLVDQVSDEITTISVQRAIVVRMLRGWILAKQSARLLSLIAEQHPDYISSLPPAVARRLREDIDYLRALGDESVDVLHREAEALQSAEDTMSDDALLDGIDLHLRFMREGGGALVLGEADDGVDQAAP